MTPAIRIPRDKSHNASRVPATTPFIFLYLDGVPHGLAVFQDLVVLFLIPCFFTTEDKSIDFSHCFDQIPDKKQLKGGRSLFWLTVLELSVHLWQNRCGSKNMREGASSHWVHQAEHRQEVRTNYKNLKTCSTVSSKALHLLQVLQPSKTIPAGDQVFEPSDTSYGNHDGEHLEGMHIYLLHSLVEFSAFHTREGITIWAL